MRTPRRRLRPMPAAAKSDRPDLPTSLRLTADDLARADALRAAMARGAGFDSASAVHRHAVLLAAVRAGLSALERKHKLTRPKAK